MRSGPGAFLAFLSLTFIGLALAASIAGWGVHAYLSRGPLAETGIVLIERGSGVSAIATKLEAEGVISSALVFKIAVRVKKTAGELKAGEYEFPAQVPMAEVMRKIHAGEVFDRNIMVPEGLTSYQIVKILNGIEGLEGEITTIPAEGTILPETYQYIKGDTRADKLFHMQQAMTSAIEELWPARAEGLPFDTKEQMLTLASIVEKETSVPEERKRVAGVFINRLRQNIPLQTDPTVIYAITQGEIQENGMGPLGRRLLTKDLEVDSPYNTY